MIVARPAGRLGGVAPLALIATLLLLPVAVVGLGLMAPQIQNGGRALASLTAAIGSRDSVETTAASQTSQADSAPATSATIERLPATKPETLPDPAASNDEDNAAEVDTNSNANIDTNTASSATGLSSDSIGALLSELSLGPIDSGEQTEAQIPVPSPAQPTDPDAPVVRSSEIADLLASLSAEDTAGTTPAAQTQTDPATADAQGQLEPLSPELLSALGLPGSLDQDPADSNALPAEPAPETLPDQSPSASSENNILEVTEGLNSLPVQSAARAGGTEWNRRFPWIEVAPFLVDGVTLVENPDLPPPVVANSDPGLAGATDSSARPQSFLVRRSTNPASEAPEQSTEPQSEPLASAPVAETRDLAAEVTAYGRRVSTIIAENITYPPEFLAQRLEGTVELGVILTATGDLSQSVVLQSSGTIAIDQAAQAIVSRLTFPRPPAGADETQLRYGVRMRFVPPS